MDTMIDPYLLEENIWLGMTSLGEAGVYVNHVLDRVLPKSNEGRFQRQPDWLQRLIFFQMGPEEAAALAEYQVHSHYKLARQPGKAGNGESFKAS